MNAEAIMEIAWRLLAVLVLVFLNGFFVAAEFALVKIRDTQLEGLILKGNRRAKITRKVIKNLDASLSACQLGITLASLGLGWAGEPVFTRLLEPLFNWLNTPQDWRHWIAFMVGFSAITFLHITAGEQAPKWFAIQRPLPTSLWVARPLDLFHRISWPFIWLLNHSSQWMLRQFGVETASEASHAHSEEEIRLLVSANQQQAGVTQLGRDIVLNALDLRHRIVREVMRPRQEITVLNTQATLQECLEIAERTRYSRFPLCEDGEIDRSLGVVHIKDMLVMRKQAGTARDLLPAAKRIIYLPPTARLEKLLQLFLDRKLHLAIVVDEYGGTIGMATLENILEELVGQIQDEFDQEKPLFVSTGQGTWEIDGSLPLHQLADLVHEPIEAEGVSTVSGWVTRKLGGFPNEDDKLTIGRFELQVVSTDGPRVTRLKLSPHTSAPDNPAAG